MNDYNPIVYLTESLWRDEAFTVLLARHSLAEIISLTSLDFNPPFYYLLLHGWMRLFGPSEIAIRSLSLLFFIFLLLINYRFCLEFVTKKWAKAISLLMLINPMLFYYAFEARMYSMFAFLATLSMFAFYKRKWLIYILSTVCGLYTHSYMAFMVMVQVAYVLILLLKKNTNNILPFFLSLGSIALLYAAWIPILISQWMRSRQSWIYPIDIQLILSVLGNLFTGYEGTPAGLWRLTSLLSLVLIGTMVVFTKKKLLPNILFTLWIALPLILVLAVSLVKPLFVNRYLIFVSVAEVMVMGLVIAQMNDRRLQISLYSVTLLACLAMTIFSVPYKKKLDMRSVYQQLNTVASKNSILMVDPLVLFEGLYYYTYPSRIFIYNPQGTSLPSYLGTAITPKETVITSLPQGFPIYTISRDGAVAYSPSHN